MTYSKLVLSVWFAAGVATAGSYQCILNENYQQGPRQEHVQQFTLYHGDTILVETRVTQGNDISDLAFADADGNTLLSRHAYKGGDETLGVASTGFYSLTIRNTGMVQKKTYSVRLERYNADPRIMAKSTAYRTKTVCDTTWKHFTRVETLGVERVDTTADTVLEKTPHLAASYLGLGSGQTKDLTAETIPAVDYVSGYEPKVVFYAANVGSYRALADMAAGLAQKAAAATTGGIAGLLLSGIDLSKIAKGSDFGWQLEYAYRNAEGQIQMGTQTPYCHVKSTYEVVSYSDARPRAWSIMLDHSFSQATAKDIVLKVYVVKYSPVFKTAEHADSTAQVEIRKVPIMPDE